MASRSIEVVISARDQFTGTANKVIGSLNRMDSAAGRVGKGVGQVGMGLARVAVIGATAAAGGLTLVAKKTIDWESALAGVNKTMDLTPGELQGIGTEIRKLATDIPLSANALAGLVEQAGALGIAKQDVLAFAEATATIGVTTNVVAEQAASSLGILSNLLGLTGKDFERFGSALVDLGNKGASTEDQILAIAERGAGAAATIGASAEQLLGWAAAIANIGMEPEAAGTSFQRFALGVQKFTRAGGDELKVLAATAGMTGDAFQKAFDEDASGALESFVNGLAKLKKGERLDVLTALGFDDARLGRMLLGLAEAELKNDNLTKALDISAEAWKANTAAAEEADKRYGTTASKLALLNNQFTESALLIGEGFLPALGRVSDKLKAALGDEKVRNDLRQFGKDIGDFIEGIDFEAVIGGAKTLASLLKDGAGFAKTMFDWANMLPGPLKAAGLGFLTLNKLSGGLIGSGVGNILGGLVTGLGSRAPGGIGQMFAQPVRVVNWPVGFGLGGPLDILGGKGKGGILRTILSTIGLAFVAAAPVIIAKETGLIDELMSNVNRTIFGDKTASDIETFNASLLKPGDTRNPRAEGNPFAGGIFDPNRDVLKVEIIGPPTPRGWENRGPEVFGPPAPIDSKDWAGGFKQRRDLDSAAILQRALAAGFKPTAAAVEATLQRNLLREQERTKAAIDAVKDEAARTTAAAQRTAFAIEHKADVPIVIPAPQVQVVNNISATGVTHTTVRLRRYGPTGGSREISEGGGHGPLI